MSDHASLGGTLAQTIHNHLVGMAANYFDEDSKEQQQEASERDFKVLGSNDGSIETELDDGIEMNYKEEFERLRTSYQLLMQENERLRRAYIVETIKTENTAMCTSDREICWHFEKEHLLKCLQVRTEYMVRYENETRLLKEELKIKKEKSG
eukprot:TCONS_00022252-protein